MSRQIMEVKEVNYLKELQMLKSLNLSNNPVEVEM